MPKPKKPKTYKELRDEWYKKLADTPDKNGEYFVDAERNEYDLKDYSSRVRARYKYLTKNSYEALVSYYQMAENFLEEYRFNDNIEQIIWEYHTNGMSYRDIAVTLKKLKLTKKINKNNVNDIIKRLKTKMFDMYMLQHEAKHE